MSSAGLETQTSPATLLPPHAVRLFVLLLLVSATIQVSIAWLPDTMGDVLFYRLWMRKLVDSGLTQAYWDHSKAQSYGKDFYYPIDYPPVYPYLLLGLGTIVKAFSTVAFEQNDHLLDFLIKLLSILASLATAGLIFRELAGKRPAIALLAAGAFLFNPAVLFDVAYWGQTDSITAFWLLLSLILLVHRKPEWALVCITIGVFTKPLVAPMLPLVLLATWKFSGAKRTLSALAAAVFTGLLIFLPFVISGKSLTIIREVFLQIDAMPYVSVNAHNLWWLAGRGLPWVNANEMVLNLVSYRGIGLILFGAFYALSLVKFYRSETDESLYFAAAGVALGFFVLSTHMHENHCFHFFPLFSMVCFGNARLKRIYLILSLTFLANMALHDPYLTVAFKHAAIGPRLMLPPQPGIGDSILDYFGMQGYSNVAEQARGDSSLLWLVLTILNSQINVCIFAYWLLAFFGRPDFDDLEQVSGKISWRIAAPLIALFVVVTGGAVLHRAFTTKAQRTQSDLWRYSLLEHLGDATVDPQSGWTCITAGAVVGEIERPAILMHSPTQLTFALHLPVGTRLSFGVGIQTKATDAVPHAAGSPRATFRIAVSLSGKRRMLWTQALDAGDDRWHDVDVDVPAGTEDVSLEVEGNEMVARQAVWSMPVLRSSATTVPNPTHRYNLVRDLLKDTAPPIDPGSFVAYGGLLRMDLNHRSAASPAGDLTEQRFVVDLIPGEILDLGAEILRGPATPGVQPVRFSAEIDGHTVAMQSVNPQAAPLELAWRVPLQPGKARKAEVVLRVEGHDPHTVAWWTLAGIRKPREFPRSVSNDGPNILFLLVDTLRADHLGLYGSRRPTSPALDEFARQGLVFENAVSTAPWTQPSIATLFTGLDPPLHGVVGGTALPPEPETLAEALAGRGFTTMAVSANPAIGWREGFSRGFETFVQLPWTRATSVNTAFLDWAQAHQTDRWMAYLHYIDPHDPYNPPVDFAGLFTRQLPVLAKSWDQLHQWDFGYAKLDITRDDVAWMSGAYDEEIRYWDSCFRNLLETLNSGGFAHNTIIVVMGDHGEEFLDHNRLFHECQLYRESVHVPLIISGPNITPDHWSAPYSTDHLKDLILSLASGTSLKTRQEDNKSLPTGPAFSHTALGFPPGGGHYETLASVRDNDWTCILHLADGRTELYDLRQDPQELVDVVAREPDRAKACEKRLREWAQSGPPAPRWDDPGVIEKLRSLGYIQ